MQMPLFQEHIKTSHFEASKEEQKPKKSYDYLQVWVAIVFGLWCVMDLICNLLKLTIISKSISRWVELHTAKQKFVTSDNRERNSESITLRCLTVNDERSDKQLTMLGMFCQWQRADLPHEVGSSLVVGYTVGQGFKDCLRVFSISLKQGSSFVCTYEIH